MSLNETPPKPLCKWEWFGELIMILLYEYPFYLRTGLINTGTAGVRVLLINNYYPVRILVETSKTVVIVTTVQSIFLRNILLLWNCTFRRDRCQYWDVITWWILRFQERFVCRFKTSNNKWQFCLKFLHEFIQWWVELLDSFSRQQLTCVRVHRVSFSSISPIFHILKSENECQK